MDFKFLISSTTAPVNLGLQAITQIFKNVQQGCPHCFLSCCYGHGPAGRYQHRRDPPQSPLAKVHKIRLCYPVLRKDRPRLQLALAPQHQGSYQLLHWQHLGRHALPRRHDLRFQLRSRRCWLHRHIRYHRQRKRSHSQIRHQQCAEEHRFPCVLDGQRHFVPDVQAPQPGIHFRCRRF